MRKYIYALIICLLASTALGAQKLVDIRFDAGQTSDQHGNVTDITLLRDSAGTYVDSGGVLQTGWELNRSTLPQHHERPF